MLAILVLVPYKPVSSEKPVFISIKGIPSIFYLMFTSVPYNITWKVLE